MAQLFDTNVPETTGVLNVPQPHAVENDSTATLIGQLGDVGLNEAHAVDRSIIAGNKLKAFGNVADYTVQLGKIQQAVAQGSMSSAAARTRIRVLRSNVIANNPTMLPQIDSATSSFLSDSGLGSDIVKGTQAEQQEQKLEEAAGKAGFVTPDMTDEQKQAGVAAWQQLQYSQAQLQHSSAQVALTNAKLTTISNQGAIRNQDQSYVTGGITQQTDRLTLEQKQHLQAANNALFTGAKAYATKFQTDMQGIIKKFDASGKTPADKQAAVDQINLTLAQIKSGVSQAGLGADQSVLTQAISPMQDLATAAIGFVNGKVETQAYTDAVNNAQNAATLLALHAMDAKSRAIVGTMRAAPGMSQAMGTKWADSVALQVTGDLTQDPTTGKTPKVVVGKDDPDYGSYGQVFDGIKATIGKANLGTLDPNSQKMLDNSLTNLANGIVGNTKASKPQDYNQITSFLSDPAVNAYVAKHPDLMRTAGIDMPGGKQASEVYHQEVVQNIKPLIQKEWENAPSIQGGLSRDYPVTTSTPYGNVTVPGFKQVPVKEVVHPEFVAGGVRFVPNDPKNQFSAQSADYMNQKVAPVMSKLIRATATLDGTSNFRKEWNDNFAGWFGQKPEPEPVAAAPAPKPAQTTVAEPLTMDKATPDLMNSLWGTESNHNNAAVSSKGAVSIGQIMPGTADALGYSVEDLKNDPELAKKASTQYVNMMLARFDGHVKLALAAYNYGPTNVAKLVQKYGESYDAIEPHLPKETRDYVPKVLGGLAGK